MPDLKFPKNFLWGAATSAHQVEGGNVHNDWWQAELQGLVPHQSGEAADQYNRFTDDFALAKKLNHNAHRISLEWSRLEPEPGKFDATATRHYNLMVLKMREQGLEPVVTLHHFTNPAWFAEKGGWSKKSNIKYFTRYVEYCTEHFGDYVNWWITINEPTVYAVEGYLNGKWPPFKKNFLTYWKVVKNLSTAHRQASKILKKYKANNLIGIAHNVSAWRPANPNNKAELILAKLFKYFATDYPLKLLKNNYDFIGLNYYFLQRVYWSQRPTFLSPLNSNRSDLGWEIAPQGLLQVLRELHKYRKPILITENGLADAIDSRRTDFIINHLLMVYVALTEGINIRGYLHWSLIDNFEWAEGFTPRFGLIAVDYNNQNRAIRESAWRYTDIIKQNAISEELLAEILKDKHRYYPEILQKYLQKITLIKPLK